MEKYQGQRTAEAFAGFINQMLMKYAQADQFEQIHQADSIVQEVPGEMPQEVVENIRAKQQVVCHFGLLPRFMFRTLIDFSSAFSMIQPHLLWCA